MIIALLLLMVREIVFVHTVIVCLKRAMFKTYLIIVFIILHLYVDYERTMSVIYYSYQMQTKLFDMPNLLQVLLLQTMLHPSASSYQDFELKFV